MDSRVAAVVLAAGSASRYRAAGGLHASKVIAPLGGVPMVRAVTLAALASRAAPVVVVTGYAARAVAQAVAGLDVGLAENPDFARGLSASLRVGIAALPEDVAGTVVLLADMPAVTATVIDRLVAAFLAEPEAAAVVPTLSGAWGNPVLLSRTLFLALARLSGDEGARRLLRGRDDVVEVAVEDEAVTRDLDVPGDGLA